MDGRTLGPPEVDAGAAGVVGALALLYMRHGDAPRALALGLAAMRLAPPAPRLVLLVAAAFLRVGDADQALAALSRLDGGEGGGERGEGGGLARAPLLAAPPTAPEAGAAGVLRAKALFRQGRLEEARTALAQGQRLLATEEGES